MDYANPTSGELVAGLNDPAASILLRLIRAPIPTAEPEIAWGALTEANFDGYAPIKLETWDETDEFEEEIGEVLTEPNFFTAGDNVGSQAIFGYAITISKEGAPIGLLDAQEFDEPIVIDTPGQEIPIVCRVRAVNEAA